METQTKTDKRRASKIGISLFPVHEAIVEQFATESERNFSNAVQFIITDWARMKQQAIKQAEPEPEAA